MISKNVTFNLQVIVKNIDKLKDRIENFLII